jgi:hypothetical protein
VDSLSLPVSVAIALFEAGQQASQYLSNSVP